MINRAKQIWRNRQGATAVETALVLPFVVAFLFGILQISLIYYDIAMTQNSLEEAAREILMLDNPTDQEVYDAATNAVFSPSNGSVVLTTTIVERFGSDYADLDAAFSYSVAVPFTNGLAINKTLATSIILQR